MLFSSSRQSLGSEKVHDDQWSIQKRDRDDHNHGRITILSFIHFLKNAPSHHSHTIGISAFILSTMSLKCKSFAS